MIQDIERIGPELKLHSFSQSKESDERQIGLRKSKAGDVVPALGALANCRRHHKGVWIERLSSWSLRISHPKRLTWNQICTGKLSRHLGRTEVDACVERKSRSGHDHGIGRPASGYRRQHSGSLGGRKLPCDRTGKTLTNVEVGWRVVALCGNYCIRRAGDII